MNAAVNLRGKVGVVDLVRWDKFAKGSWTFKEALNNNSRDLFPIPYDQITKNQSWKQNPGY